MSSDLPRRTLLAGGGALLAAVLTGCSGDPPDRDEGGEQSTDARRTRRTAESDSAVLLAHYDAVLEAHPGLAEPLGPPRAAVAAHLTVLREDAPSEETAEAAAPAGTPAVDADSGTALRELAAAEEDLAATRLGALDGAPPELARLLASLAAAGTTHAHLLQEVAS